MDYTTQMDAARKGIITKELQAVAEKEQMDTARLMQLVAEGKVAIPANKNHKCLDPNGIGSMLKTKINVNLGTSRDCKDLDMELQKVNDAVKMGAESIMDLSSWGDTQKFRRKLTAECPAIIGTVPIYDAVVYYHKALKDITTEEWLKIVEMHAQDGVDFMTIHIGINRATAQRFKKNKRLMNIVSRGGSIIFAWMEMTGQENPFYEHFDEILDICAKQVMKLLEKNVIIYHAVGGEVKQPRVYLSNDAEEMAGGILLNEDETAVAGWVCKNCHKAGCTTNTLPGAAGLYIPIQKDGRVFGVIGIDLKEGAPIKPNDKNVLHVILDETAVVLKAQMIHGYL